MESVVRTEDADEYAPYIRDTGFTAYGETEGKRGAWMLRRDRDGETTVSNHEIVETIEP